MTAECWFSATLRFFIVNSAVGKMMAEDRILLPRAIDFTDAFNKFLELGREREYSSRNHVNEEIRERFATITTLDIIRSESLDGAEVNSIPIFDADQNITLDSPLAPEASQPTQTI
jgi:hypothetical protein